MANEQKQQNDIAQLSMRHLKEARQSLIKQRRECLMQTNQRGLNRDIA
jgi:hypothetical protein